MGWETRESGRYYYRKRRVDGRVVSEYVGRGLNAQKAEKEAQKAKLDRAVLRLKRRQQSAQDREIDSLIRNYTAQVKVLTEALLVISGHHKHKGQWRRRRGRKSAPAANE